MQIDQPDPLPFYQAADVFVLPTFYDPCSLVVMEAMAAGLPVVAVDASGTCDIVDNGEQGLLVSNDPNALADSMSRLLESPERMQRFRRRALERAKSFDLKICAKQLINVYEQAIQDKAEHCYVRIEDGEDRKDR